ncbi:MAG: signal peptide peptidase SppA [Thermoanaerobaculia bacterium]
MKKETNRFFLIAGILVAVCVVAGLVVRFAGGGRPIRAGTRIVLDLNLETEYPESVPDNPVGRLLVPTRTTLRELVETIDRAGHDRAVAGLVARIGAAPMGLAQTQEIRDAVRRFRARKKFAVAFSETFGEIGSGSVSYYLATAFEEIWLQPSGDVWLTGIAMESPFIRGTLDKLTVKPSLGQRHEYKNAANFYTDTKFTTAHREAMERLKESWFSQIVRGISEGRRISTEQVRAAVDRGPFLGKEAVEAKLVDRLGYRDEVVAGRAGGNTELVGLGRYRKQIGDPRGRHRLALVYGVGAVVRGRSEANPTLDSVVMGSDTVSAALRDAAEDPRVRAIVFRVDSPGGSYVASDTIWREVKRAREAGKPVVASMGNLAGSGGYFVAMSADKIVAQPATVTGSIGVFGGKFVLSGLFEKVGLSFDEVHAGENALFWDPNRDFSPSERARFEAWLDRVYEDFTSKAAEGRHLPKERVLQIARGRIWSGEDAKELKLVDELGGLDTAVRLARRAARIPDTETVVLETFPKPRTFFQSVLSRFGGKREEETAADASTEILVRAVRTIQPVARKLKALGLLGQTGVLSMPPVTAVP